MKKIKLTPEQKDILKCGEDAGGMKDWTGNKRTLGSTIGASSHTHEDRQREDYYATDPDMVRDLLNAGAPIRQRVWEPACGAGHIVNVLREHGYEVYATDIVDRGCPDSCLQDFLWEFDGAPMGDVDIMTNPPYAMALESVKRAASACQAWRQCLDASASSIFRGTGPAIPVQCDASRGCMGIFQTPNLCQKWCFFPFRRGVAFAWFHWIKGCNKQTVVKWL